MVKAFINDARLLYLQSSREQTSVYTVDSDGYWMTAGTRPSRPISSVVLPDGMIEALGDDCADFLESEAWYTRMGVPYRRGYLLYGPPGTGARPMCNCAALQFQAKPARPVQLLQHLLIKKNVHAQSLNLGMQAAQ